MIVTTEELQGYTGVEFEEGNDIAVLFIKSAQDIVENYLGYKIESASYTKHYTVESSRIIKAGIKNITEVASLTLDGTDIADTDYYFDDDKIVLNTASSGEVIATFTAGYTTDDLPNIMKLTVLRISALLQEEANNNIGITSKSFMNEGTRTFTNYTNFDKYLIAISKYKLI